jgi:beta-lactam-binding protein with PASTA domain
VDQYPAAHTRVKKGHMIHLTTNATNPEKITVPRVQNTAYRQTLQTLEARGFRIGRLEFVPSEFPNLVLGLKHNRQNISDGTLLPKGSVIDIILGNDPEKPFLPIPSVTGKTHKEAVDILRKAYFNIGKTIPDGSIDRKANTAVAIVCQQNPETGFSVRRGSNIDLYITLNPEKIAALDSLTLTEE